MEPFFPTSKKENTPIMVAPNHYVCVQTHRKNNTKSKLQFTESKIILSDYDVSVHFW